LIYESSDLVYHLLVMLAHNGVPFEDVEAEIARRFGQSGLEEKGARPAMTAK
jgi:phosphoribosyl-ATP pyrophosphohydrolase